LDPDDARAVRQNLHGVGAGDRERQADVAVAGEIEDVRAGDGGNDTLIGGGGVDYLSGGADDDLIIVSGDSDNASGDDGDDVIRGSEVADWNLSGGADNDSIFAAGGADYLYGGTGDDSLDGGAGDDRMYGDRGNDTYVVDSLNDQILSETAETGVDLVQSSVDWTLGDFLENLTLTGAANLRGTGNELNNRITGNAGSNTLLGLGGSDTLDGGGGADRMEGGVGNDVYYVDHSGDRVIEAKGAGTDLVYSSVSFALTGQYVERLTLTGTADINATGNSQDNRIIGNSGANVIDGGTGADTMQGGAGGDTYYVQNAGDRVIEANVAGYDTVFSSVTYSLKGQYVEALTLTGSASIDATGNTLHNVLTGNAGVNILRGGAGDDTYYVQNLEDRALESNGDGFDQVFSTVSYSLAGQYIENLTLTGEGDGFAIGNGLANVLVGNSGDNNLDGGRGADTMEGGAGDDVYAVDSLGDRVIEATGQGFDQVYSSVSFSLAGQYVEQLVLTSNGAVDGTGNNLANGLIGNSAANVLDGWKGADTLSGGGGQDTFSFATALGASNVDHITDFIAADDSIRLENGVFKGLAAGALKAGAFYAGTAAHDADDRIIYDQASGSLFFDRDGTGGTYAAVRFAILDNHAALTAADFTVV
ncbi:hypothetical protein ACIKTA_06070, partial [Hansschlegelia beijingensis]